ncbi:MAG TPA: adenylate/guanylate cyclase domain-containing protein [Actinomycetota bacterium]|nr:adenylate/guanylate cyclase domain-containing protein [Actinomycetota bacterium]
MPEREPLSLDDVARRAGISVDEARSLLELGLLLPAEDGTLAEGDVRRARLVHSCDEAGLASEAIAEAVRAGRLSLAFLDVDIFRWAARTPRTYEELADEHALPVDLLLDAHEALGVIRPAPSDPALDEDIELLPLLVAGRRGGIPDDVALRTLRVYTESLRRIAEAETDVFHDHVELPLMRSGMAQREMMEIANASAERMAPTLDRALMAIRRRQQEHTWTEDMVEHIELALDEAGVRQRAAAVPAMCFLDISGYTALTEARGDEAAAELVATLAALVRRVSGPQGGRVVKRLGDGIMLHFRDPGRAVVAALDMTDLVTQAGLPPAHVGVDAGPVVAQDGDYYGRTVNMAARVADKAGPGEVLVTAEVVRLSTAEEIRFHERGAVEMKGVAQPILVHEAVRA